MTEAIATSWTALSKGSKSFALAARLFPRGVADDAAVVYRFCRHADDAIDLAAPAERPAALERLRAEIDAVYAGTGEPFLAAVRDVVERRRIPRRYLDELIDGMEMDVRGERYSTLEALLVYCHRVAGVVGLVMCHVMGVRDDEALRNAAHLGIAMQLTNICRDVAEDWDNGRLYLPASLVGSWTPSGPFPAQLRDRARDAIATLLAEADRYYRSADEAFALLGFRCAFAVRTARLVYAEIGRRIESSHCDVLAGRAVVPLSRKLALVAKAFFRTLAAVRELPAPHPPLVAIRFPDDVLPL